MMLFLCITCFKLYLGGSVGRWVKYSKTSCHNNVQEVKRAMRIQRYCIYEYKELTLEDHFELVPVMRDTIEGYVETYSLRTKVRISGNENYYIKDPLLVSYIQDKFIDKVDRDAIANATNGLQMHTAIMNAFNQYFNIYKLYSLLWDGGRNLGTNICCTGNTWLISDGHVIAYEILGGAKIGSTITTVKGFVYWLQIWSMMLTYKTVIGFCCAVSNIISICENQSCKIPDLYKFNRTLTDNFGHALSDLPGAPKSKVHDIFATINHDELAEYRKDWAEATLMEWKKEMLKMFEFRL
jgi:hypothetical protein